MTMSTKTHLLEAATLASESAAEDGTWRVKVISEGKGSSGTYTADLLENHHHALDDILSFRNHPTGWDGPQSRDFTMISGEIIGETWIDVDERGLKAVYANYLPDPEYREKLERYKNKLGLSIYIEGSGYEDENGEFIVDWLNPEDPYASLDVVIAPGARGKFMENMRKTYESANPSDSNKPSVTSAREEGKLEMDQEIKDAFQALNDLIAPLVANEQAAKAEAAQAEADEKAIEAAVAAYDSAVKAIDAAELLPVQVEALRAEALKGVDVAPLIEQAKALKEAAIEAVRVTESAPGRGIGGEPAGEYTLKGFGGSK